MRAALALMAVLCAACADTVLLGTECLTSSGACEERSPPVGDGTSDGGSAPQEFIDAADQTPSADLDGGIEEDPPVETPQLDGGPLRDGGPASPRDAAPPPVPEDAGPARFPAFINPSFELVDGGREGPVGEVSVGASAATATSIAPWYACRDGLRVSSSVTYGLPGRQETVTPRQGNTFLTDTFPIVVGNFSGITQELAQPLEPGKRYAFAVDVYAQPDPLMLRDFQLQLSWADTFGCFGLPLAATQPIPPGSWQTRCMDFIAPQPMLSREGARYLIFFVAAPGDLVNLTALHFDNIRPDAMCGNEMPAANTP